ncbi:MAG: ankyrin repeat domain-containing protein [Planctomycetes bacterium]|nr:ankyrin repeat domain-containing protein [Planctomycetota bacterium]MBL7038543.1 ankyrin repeat domain-containing protein [Pirellulaceae bacterium]
MADVIINCRQQRITPLIDAVQKQNVDAVKSRIEAGDDIEGTDSFGETALHWAAKDKSAEIVRLLVKAGANVNAQDEDGDTPLQNAEKNACFAIAEILGRSCTEKSSAEKKWWQLWK